MSTTLDKVDLTKPTTLLTGKMEHEPESKHPETEQTTPDIEFDPQTCLTSENIAKIMNKKGPVVKAVLLKVDGSMTEIDYDSTPKRCHLSEFLGGLPTFVGQWSDLGVLIVVNKDTTNDTPINKHKLRFPFNNKTIRGSIVLYRVDDNSNNTDFTLKEYVEFNSKAHEDVGKVWKSPEKENNRDCSNEEESYEEDEEQPVDIQQVESQVNNVLGRQFKIKYGREPTEEEKKLLRDSIMNSFFQKFGNLDDNEVNDPTYDPKEDNTEMEPEQETTDELQSEFRSQFNEVLNSFQELTSRNSSGVCKMLKENYLNSTGEKCSHDKILECFKMLNVTLNDESKDNETDSFIVDDSNEENVEMPLSEEEVRNHIAEAFDVIRQRARMDGQKIAKMISSTYHEINGKEASVDDMKNIFNRLKNKLKDDVNDMNSNLFTNNVKVNNNNNNLPKEELLKYAKTVVTQSMANEARLEFIKKVNREPTLEELNNLILTLATTRFIDADFNYEDSDNDSNYNPNDKDELEQEKNDIREDTIENDNEVKENKDVKKSIAFFSPMRVKNSPKQNYNEINQQFLQRAIKHFKHMHKRDPTEKELEHLNDFLSTSKLPIQEPIENDDEIISNKLMFGDDNTGNE